MATQQYVRFPAAPSASVVVVGGATAANQVLEIAQLTAINANTLAIANDFGGRLLTDSVRKDYSSGSVTTGAWVQLIASTSATSNQLQIFDSSGQTMEIGVGAAASEVRIFITFPGGNGPVPVLIPAGSRVSVRAVSATASVGELDINFFS